MKIISKYKDFYDYIVQDHDADLTYVRNIGLVNEYLDELFKKDNNSIPYYSNYYGYIDSYNRYRKNGDLVFSNIIFGIYPFVYSQPILKINYKYNASNTIESVLIILGRELVDKLLDKSNIVSKAALENELLPLAQKEFNKLDRGICDYTKVSFIYKDIADVQDALKGRTWKIECPEIFYKIESPVFVKYVDDLFINGSYWDHWPETPRIGNGDYTHYVTGISFQKLNYNILKYWYNDLFDLNTYINIENFLWSIKQEPEAKPDNKTKILAHGFDLKTSFRKDKCNK